MSTKTMRLPLSSALMLPSPSPAPNKRIDKDDNFDPPKPSSSTKMLKPDHKLKISSEPPGLSNQLLAGCLAHEFLTKGTLFGQPWDSPCQAEGPAKKMKGKLKEAESQPEKCGRYVEVADLLKEDGPYLPGIVNPTQLARFLQL